jgi:hypothetical protein
MALWHRLTARQRLVTAGAAVVIALLVVALLVTRDGDERVAGGAGSPSGEMPSSAPTASATQPVSPDGQAAVPTPAQTAAPDSGADDLADPPAAGGRVPVPPLAHEPTVAALGESPVSMPGGVRLGVVGVTAVSATGSGPGQLSGPAVAVEVEVVNESEDDVDLGVADVGVYYGSDGVPSSLVTSDPAARPLGGVLAPGDTATGVYIALVPVEARELVAVVVQMGDAPAAIFEGPAPA